MRCPQCDDPFLQVVQKSFLGVGAPEAVLVAVVALVVFGPKGLADVSCLEWEQAVAQACLTSTLSPSTRQMNGFPVSLSDDVQMHALHRIRAKCTMQQMHACNPAYTWTLVMRHRSIYARACPCQCSQENDASAPGGIYNTVSACWCVPFFTLMAHCNIPTDH